MNPNRILFFSSWYPSEENPSLGIFVQRHAEALTMAGMQVLVISAKGVKEGSLSFTEAPERVKGLKEICIEFPKNQKSLFQRAWFVLKERKKIISFFEEINKEFQPQLLQINIAYPIGILWWMFRDYLPKKIVLAEHWSGYLPEDGRYKGMFRELITQSLVRKAATIMVVSEAQRIAMHNHGLVGNYIDLPNVIDERIFSFQKREIASTFNFVHVSSLDQEEKNPELLLRAFAKLFHQNQNIRLCIIGGDSERLDFLKKYAEDLRINHLIEWKGNLPGKEVAQKLHDCHAFVLSSNFEGQPVVLLEALSTGIPVVASAVGGIPNLVSYENGCLFPPGDEKSMVKAMLEIIEQYDRFNGELISKKVQAKHGIKAVSSYFSSVYSRVVVDE
jgi:L-malate glycosyltransferase